MLRSALAAFSLLRRKRHVEIQEPVIEHKLVPWVLRDADNHHLCPDCGGSYFREGPSAGAGGNIECVGCGSRFNHSSFVWPWVIERIGGGTASAHALAKRAKFKAEQAARA